MPRRLDSIAVGLPHKSVTPCDAFLSWSQAFCKSTLKSLPVDGRANAVAAGAWLLARSHAPASLDPQPELGSWLEAPASLDPHPDQGALM
eukprot:360046-Chlamydomonas_euryale.AAC.4